MLARLLLTLLAFSPLPVSAYRDDTALERAVGSDTRYVTLPLQQKQAKSPLKKRYSDIPIFSEEPSWLYLVNITVGSNNQTVPVIFDTGSPYTWVNPDCSKARDEKHKAACLAKSRYDPFASTNAKILNESFNVTYGVGTVLGTYFTDDIGLGGAVAKNTQFGIVAACQGCDAGLLGINSRNNTPPSPIQNLVSEGKIDSNAFSVDLRSLDETGAVVIGGIDTKKYQCSLTKMEGSTFITDLTGLGLTFPNGTAIAFNLTKYSKANSNKLSVYLDTGTQTNLLPNGLYYHIFSIYPDAVNYTYVDGERTYNRVRVPCDAPHGTFDYTFGNTTIKVSFQDSLYYWPDGNCTFGFTQHPGDSLGFYVPYILANTFMRGAYLVFDIDNNDLWIGQSADCGSNIVPIGKGKDAIPVLSGCGCKIEQTGSVSATMPCTTAESIATPTDEPIFITMPRTR